MEIVTAVIAPVVELLIRPIKKHLGFLVSSTKYVRDKDAQMKRLDAAVKDTNDLLREKNVNRDIVPRTVPVWLEEAEKVKAEAASIVTGGNRCFNMKMRYNAGKCSSHICNNIDSLMKQYSEFQWPKQQRHLGRITSEIPSTSAAPVVHDGTQNSFPSRELIFQDALKFLDPNNNKTQMIALCGMGGVGKTTMMEQLKKTVTDRRMFHYVIKADIGQKTDVVAVQDAIADYIGGPLTEKVKGARADSLSQRFSKIIKDGKDKILVILDDLWNVVDLKDIGLPSPLPNNIKLLLTSRDETFCSLMGVENSSIFRMDVIKESEAKHFFWEIAGHSNAVDPEFHKVGEDIAKSCRGLPIAIKTIASNLKDKKKYYWERALDNLKYDFKNLYDIAYKVFEISYNYLQKDDVKAIFVLCGLFPDDFDIPIEDLMRYGWGLKLFKDDFDIPIERARRQANICVDDLRRANLLIKSDQDGCIKMHDLARGYVLSNISKFKQASIVNPGDHSQWPTHDSRECLERALLKCTDMSEFPKVFNYPNLTLLILRNGEKILKFPEDFYERMKKLEVISYDEMHVSLLHRSLQCSTNLRSLCFHGCKLMIDFSFIGDLLNLEVLSFAHCGIKELPSAIGKLTKLKLLDLTGCVNLRIDGRVFRNLEYLTELYAERIWFSDFNRNELKMHITKLFALEVELYNYNCLENVSFAKLERFRISMGCSLEAYEYKKKYSFKNRLRLKVHRNTLLEYEINELFEKTEELYFEVNGVIHLLDFSMHTSQHSFCNLRNLEVDSCSDLTYLFTVQVTSGLIKLESLTISKCPLLKTLVLGESENNGGGVIEFPKLKFLHLDSLPQLVSLCDSDNVVELPQLVDLELEGLRNFTSIYRDNEMKPFFNKEVKVPKLEKLMLYSMEKLKQIWPCKITEEEVNIISMLKEIRVKECDSLVNLFPSNPFPLLNHLEELYITSCNRIKYLFSPLMVKLLTNLKKVRIWSCDGIEEVVSNRDDHENEKMDTSYTNTTFFPHLDILYLQKLKNLKRIGGGTSSVINDELKFSQVCEVSWSLCEDSKYIRIEECNTLSSVIPFYAIGKMEKLQELTIINCNSMIEVFETNEINNNNNKSGGSSAILAIPRLGNIMMLKLPNLKIVVIAHCNLLEHIFTFSTLGTLGQLEVLTIQSCKAMKEIVKEESGEKTKIPNDMEFPCLKSINLINLPNLVGFFLGMNVFRWPVLDDVRISDCPQMTVFTSGESITSKLKYIHTRLGKHSLECGLNFHVTSTLHQTSSCCPSTLERLPWSFHNLIELHLQHYYYQSDSKIIPSSELLQLKKLEKIQLKYRDVVEEVFELAPEGTNSGSNDSKSVVKLPNLREMKFHHNDGLKYIWKSNEWTVLEFPNLTTLSISYCHQLEHVFTSSMVGSLLQLQDLEITDCRGIEVIVKEEAWDAKVKEVVLPCLKSLKFENLISLKGFCLGKDDFSWPSLNTLVLYDCPAMEVFTMGHLATPELKEIDTDFWNSCDVREDLNSFIKNKHQEQGSCSGEDGEESYSGEDREEQSTSQRIESVGSETV